MKGVYVAILALFVLGVGMSLYLLISPEDYALMMLKGEKYSGAEEYYTSQYLGGRRSAAILVPLKTLEIARGDNDKAISLLEEYIRNHPRDLYAHQLLGTLYLNGLQRTAYLSNLEQIRKLDRKEPVLSELLEWYQARGDKQKEEEVLETLISEGHGKPVHYYSLAYLLASRQDYSEAFAIMRTRDELFPRSVDFDSLRFEIALLLEMGRLVDDRRLYDSKISALTKQFFDTPQKPEYAIELLRILQSQKRQDLAFLLLPDLSGLAADSLELQTEIIQLEWNYGNPEKAYKRILYVHRHHILTDRLAELLARMAIEKKYYLILADLLDHYPPDHLSEKTLLDFAVISLQSKDPSLAQETSERLGGDFLKTHPAIRVALDLAMGNTKGDEELRTLIQSQQLTGDEALALMQLAAKRGYKPLALEIGSKLFPFAQMSSEDLFNWAIIYIDIGENKEGERLLRERQKEIIRDKEHAALAILQLSQGNAEPADTWLSAQLAPDPNMLGHFYLEAEKTKAYPFSLKAATRLNQRSPSPLSKLYYATALLNTGKVSEALPLLEHLVEVGNLKQAKIVYLKALIACGAPCKTRFENFLNEMLAQTDLSLYQKRDIGYILLQEGFDIERAQTIFNQLAHKVSPLKSDVDTYIYLLGPRPAQQDVAWIIAQAEESPAEDKWRWVKALINLNLLRETYQTVEQIPRADWNAEIYLTAMNTLLKLKEEKRLWDLLVEAPTYLSEAKDLEIAIQVAQGQGLGFLTLQRFLLEKLVHRFPENPAYWENLGRVAFEMNDFTCALEYFRCAFSFQTCTPRLYASLFLYGEMLTARNDPLLGEGFYYTALNTIQADEKQTPVMREIEAILYARLRCKWVGLHLLNDLYYQEPQPALRASMANLLMEMGHFDAAEQILYQRCDGGLVKNASFTLHWKEAPQPKVDIKDNEVIITTAVPFDRSDLARAAEKPPQGIEILQAGYRTLAIGTGTQTAFDVATEKEGEGYVMKINMTLYPAPFPPSLVLGLARANLAFRQRRFSYACCLLSDLTRRYPENVDVMALIAAVEQATGKWQCALGWIAKAHQLAPRSENLWVAYREIYFPHSRFVGFERETLLTHKTSAEHFYRFQTEWIMARNPFRFIYCNVQGETVRAHISQYFATNGLVEHFLGSRNRFHFKTRWENKLGTEVEEILYAGDGVLGLGARWLNRYDQGNFYVYADWNKPYWWILEALVHHGSETRAGAGGRYVHSSRLDGAFDVGFRQYGIRGERTATSTTKIEGSALYLLTLKNPLIGLNYTLDAEYVFAQVTKLNPFGDPFQPVPLDSRENHTLRLVVKTIWHQWWSWGAFIGETFNRLGTHNPTYGINFRYYYPCGLEMDFLAERYPSTTTLGEQATDIRGGIKWRF